MNVERWISVNAKRVLAKRTENNISKHKEAGCKIHICPGDMEIASLFRMTLKQAISWVILCTVVYVHRNV